MLKVVYRTKRGTEPWVEEVVAERTIRAERFVPSDDVYWAWLSFRGSAVLLFDADGAPHVVDHSHNHWAFDGSNWRCVTSGIYQNCQLAANECFANCGLAAAFDGAGVLHAVWFAGLLGHATAGADGWEPEVIDDQILRFSVFPSRPLGLYRGFPPRQLSLAIDPDGAAHVTYSRYLYEDTCVDAYSCSPFSELRYATNRSGAWTSDVVVTPPDRSGDGALGASLAIDPTGNPAIASIYVERAVTGSAEFSHLRYYQQQAAGTWSYQVVTERPDDYVGRDGADFTGITPYLRFDGHGRPHILFSDHASSHFDGLGAIEFRGQIRARLS